MARSIEKLLQQYNDPNSFLFKLRQGRARHVEAIIKNIYDARGKVRILDLGGSETYWKVFDGALLESCRVEITILNRYDQTMKNTSMFRSYAGDACSTGLPDNAFDLVHSNSVIEHVGIAKMADFAGEVRRLAPSYFVQTPNLYFPYEPHYRMPLIHWVPDGFRAKLILGMKLVPERNISTPAQAEEFVRYNVLLGSRKIAKLFPDAEIRMEKLFGMNKSIMAIREARPSTTTHPSAMVQADASHTSMSAPTAIP